MSVIPSISLDTIRYYNNFTKKCEVTPLEYIVWHALVVACVQKIEDKDYMFSVSISDITIHINVHKEKIRRSLVKLRNKNLAHQMNGQWVYRLDGLDLFN